MRDMELSARMLANVGLLSEGLRVADVGCDHAHVAIYLLLHKIAKKVIAMDIGAGPLERAQENINLYGLEKEIETRLSDGVQKLQIDEVDAVLIAGMGGALMKKIILQDMELFGELTEFVLQPQSEIFELRQFLAENDFEIIAEDLVYDEGKFYPSMKIKKGIKANYDNAQLCYGPCLIKDRHPVLKDYLLYEAKKLAEIEKRLIKQLEERENERLKDRLAEIKKDKALNQKVLELYV